MTYYGRWTYKYEIASEKGAAAAILIHETGPAGYPFEVVRGSWSRENFDIAGPADGQDARPGRGRGLDHARKAKELFQAGGQDFDALKKAAARPRLPPGPARMPRPSSRSRNTLREVQSQNVVARLEGSDPALKDEYVVYTAHWDHLGRDPALEGDQIFNGAADNASGVGRAARDRPGASPGSTPPPKRSILFLAVTAEEKGLLGAKYYAAHPLYPLERTLADINMDVINLWGRTGDIISIGMGQSTLDDLLVEAAEDAGPDRRARRRAREGLLLPLRPLRVRQARRARARSQGGHAATSASPPTTASRSTTSTPRTTTTRSATR